ncbi:hypothetical protein [Paenibacillus sp. BAC0078]
MLNTHNDSEIITKSYSAPVFGLNESHMQRANQFLNNNNLKNVRWNLSVSVGGAKNLTLISERTTTSLSYRYGIVYMGAPGGRFLGYLAKVFSGWNIERAIEKFQINHPNYKIKQTRIIHDQGINYGVFILYTYNVI